MIEIYPWVDGDPNNEYAREGRDSGGHHFLYENPLGLEFTLTGA